jgi:hypothetical protein
MMHACMHAVTAIAGCIYASEWNISNFDLIAGPRVGSVEAASFAVKREVAAEILPNLMNVACK